MADQKVSVGPPYFKQVAGPLLGALLLLMGIGPLLPWRRASREHLLHNFVVPVRGRARWLAGAVGRWRPRSVCVAGFCLCLFVLGTILQEFVRGALARHRATGENYVAGPGQPDPSQQPTLRRLPGSPGDPADWRRRARLADLSAANAGHAGAWTERQSGQLHHHGQRHPDDAAARRQRSPTAC